MDERDRLLRRTPEDVPMDDPSTVDRIPDTVPEADDPLTRVGMAGAGTDRVEGGSAADYLDDPTAMGAAYDYRAPLGGVPQGGSTSGIEAEHDAGPRDYGTHDYTTGAGYETGHDYGSESSSRMGGHDLGTPSEEAWAAQNRPFGDLATADEAGWHRMHAGELSSTDLESRRDDLEPGGENASGIAPEAAGGVVGALGGAIVGSVVGGPPGAIVGGIVGALGGAMAGGAANATDPDLPDVTAVDSGTQAITGADPILRHDEAPIPHDAARDPGLEDDLAGGGDALDDGRPIDGPRI